MPQNDCEKYRDMLYEYTSDMLDSSKEYELRRHIEQCSSCRTEEERIRAVIKAASEIEDVPVPDGLMSAIDIRLEQTAEELKRSKPHKIIFRRTAAAALSLAAAAALTIGMYKSGVIDAYLRSDSVFDNAPYTDGQNTDASDYTDRESSVQSNGSDSSSSITDGGQNNEPPSDNSNALGKRSSVSGNNFESPNLPNRTTADSSRSQASGTSSPKSQNHDNGTAAGAFDSDDKNPSVPNTSSDRSDSDNTLNKYKSEKSAQANSDNSLLQSGNADAQPTENDYGVSASSNRASFRLSGGCSSNSAEQQAESEKQQAPMQVYSAESADTPADSDSLTFYPTSCSVTTSEPKVYRDIYGSGTSFTVTASEWEAFKAFVANNGDTLSTGQETTSDPAASVSVRIIEK